MIQRVAQSPFTLSSVTLNNVIIIAKTSVIRKYILPNLPFQKTAHYRHLPCKCEYCTSSTRDYPYVLTPPPTPTPLSTHTKKTCMTGLRLSQTHRLSM